MCDVCVAELALREGGYCIPWHEARGGVDIRAVAEGPESMPMKYQLKLYGTDWPMAWEVPSAGVNLADVVVAYGLDHRWGGVPNLVKDWVLRKGEKPTLEELRVAMEKKKAGHTYYKCPPSCVTPHCKFCEGGLRSCTTCGGAEKQLTTECPGRSVPTELLDQVSAGERDFRDGKWVKWASRLSLTEEAVMDYTYLPSYMKTEDWRMYRIEYEPQKRAEGRIYLPPWVDVGHAEGVLQELVQSKKPKKRD